MRVNIAYGEVLEALDLPVSTLVVEPNEAEPVPDPIALIRSKVRNPVDSPSLEEFLAGSRRLLVLVNDATRPTSTASVLEAVGDILESHNARFLVATGAHREPTEDEYRFILGASYGRFRSVTESHNARDESSLEKLGETRNGTPVWINRKVAEADRIVVIGSVEPHYFAGYTGGRKAILPGVAGYRTIEANHRLALAPGARALAVEDNPVSQDMDDTLGFVNAGIFSIMTVLDRNQGLAVCAAGDIRSSFMQAVVSANAIFAVKLERRASLVISVAKSPMDINLYQAQKAIENGAMATEDGGLLILVASCREGVGDETYLNLLASASNPREVLGKIAGGYRLGYHKAAKMAQAAERIRLMALSELGAEVLGKAFIAKVGSLQEAVDDALAAKGPDARVIVLTDGTVTVPIIP
jgi:nickel-dependent lactate racemase